MPFSLKERTQLQEQKTEAADVSTDEVNEKRTTKTPTTLLAQCVGSEPAKHLN
jgi:hypothetical protein